MQENNLGEFEELFEGLRANHGHSIALLDFVHRSFEDTSELARHFGLNPDPTCYKPIERKRAWDALHYLLQFNMAYNLKLREANEVDAAVATLDCLLPQDTLFFTNGDWATRLSESPQFSWRPALESTYDGGVLAMSGDVALCIWFGDED